jgi:D-arabinose 1-dehydrogenase-like Zn-dependent alcohol dehydrogenase
MSMAIDGRLDLRAAVQDSFRLDDVNDAYGRLAAGRLQGRAIVHMH